MTRGGGHLGALRLLLTRVVRFTLVLATTLLGLVAVTFFIGRVVPIDPVLAIVGDRAPPQVYERVRLELGLDRPLVEQFVIYVKKGPRQADPRITTAGGRRPEASAMNAALASSAN